MRSFGIDGNELKVEISSHTDGWRVTNVNLVSDMSKGSVPGYLIIYVSAINTINNVCLHGNSNMCRLNEWTNFRSVNGPEI